MSNTQGSVLEKKATQVDRPYSQKELVAKRKSGLKQLRVGRELIDHTDCRHFYYAKSGGKKEKDIKESKGQIVGNCSVCWKFRRTPRNLQDIACDLVDAYMSTHPSKFSPPESFECLELELDFYTWLYNEFNPEKRAEQPHT